MSYRKELERKIEKKRGEIAELNRQIYAAESYIEGLNEALKLAPPDDDRPVPVVLRSGSDMEKVRNILKSKGKPLHIDEIIPLMNKHFTESTKIGLAGSLSSYAKHRKVFTKTASKTFGLIEFDAPENVSALNAVNE
jgi:hypothetical protein